MDYDLFSTFNNEFGLIVVTLIVSEKSRFSGVWLVLPRAHPGRIRNSFQTDKRDLLPFVCARRLSDSNPSRMTENDACISSVAISHSVESLNVTCRGTFGASQQ